MNIRPKEDFAQSRFSLHGPKEDGFVATVLFIALLVIMLMLATAGGMAVIHLHNEVKVLERQEIKKLDASAATNSASIFAPQSRRTDIK